jgi:hypothetical protein
MEPGDEIFKVKMHQKKAALKVAKSIRLKCALRACSKV